MDKKRFRLYFSKPNSGLAVACVEARSKTEAISSFPWAVHAIYEINEVGIVIG